jgi:hypothetical protein
MIPVTVISATRYNEQDFFNKAALGRALSQTYAQLPVSKRIYFENRLALASCYNDAVGRVTNQDEVLMFVHDDVHLLDFYWVDKLMAGLERFACVGLAGNKRRVPEQPNWAFIDEKFTWDDRSNLSGIVGHGTQFPCQLSFFDPVWQECKLLTACCWRRSEKSSTRAGSVLTKHSIFTFTILTFAGRRKRSDCRWERLRWASCTKAPAVAAHRRGR